MSLPLSALSERMHEKPLVQLPGRPERIRRFTIGGPEEPRDRRLELDTATLRKLLDIAEQSEAGIVVIRQAGLDVSTWRNQAGHQWDQLTITGLEPKPKRVPLGVTIGDPHDPFHRG